MSIRVWAGTSFRQKDYRAIWGPGAFCDALLRRPGTVLTQSKATHCFVLYLLLERDTKLLNVYDFGSMTIGNSYMPRSPCSEKRLCDILCYPVGTQAGLMSLRCTDLNNNDACWGPNASRLDISLTPVGSLDTEWQTA